MADYWIVNLVDRQLEVYRSPAPAADSRSGYRYGPPFIYRLEQTATPLNLPIPPVPVNRLFCAAR